MSRNPKARPLANYRYDSKRTLRGRSPDFLKLYIGRQIIHILVANEMYKEQMGESILAPSMLKALEFMRELAVGEE